MGALEKESEGDADGAEEREIAEIVDISPELGLGVDAGLDEGVGAQGGDARTGVSLHAHGESGKFAVENPVGAGEGMDGFVAVGLEMALRDGVGGGRRCRQCCGGN